MVSSTDSTARYLKIDVRGSDVCSGYRKQLGTSESPALQLAVSIQRWQSFTGDDEDDGSSIAEPSIEKKARAHRFMARTLIALPKNALKPREVKLFITFFSSMYQLHDANLAATTDALTSLVHMNSFDPSAATNILSSIGSMDPDNYTKQVAKVRLAIFTLIDSLFHGPPGRKIRDQQAQGEHLLKILPIFGRERDPFNLLQWFRFLDALLRDITLSTEAASAIFDSFSPFFPISIRKSTAPGPEVTEEQLKTALNSCFSANGTLAPRTLPFLLGKLDAGASLTAAAKVSGSGYTSLHGLPNSQADQCSQLDILRTVNACVTSYEPAEEHVFPYVSQIWSSLKYEVRHGEIPEAIQETLAVFTSVSRRLASTSLTTQLKAFVDKTWDDFAEDLENPTYTEQAGSIFISIAQAHLASFRLICPRLLDAVRRIIVQPKSPAHTKALVTVLNNLLRARRSALPPLPVEIPEGTYQDESITVTRGIYFSLWKDNAVGNPTKEQADIAKQVLEGLAQVVKQRRPANDGKSYVSDCDEVVFKEISGTLAHRVTNCFIIQVPTSQEDRAIDEAAIEALRTTVTFYPVGFGKIMSDFIGEVAKRSWTNNPTERSYEALSACCSRLASISCLSLVQDSAPLTNLVVFTGGMLKVLGILFELNWDLKGSAFVVNNLAQGLQSFFQISRTLEYDEQKDTAWGPVQNASAFVKHWEPTFPDLVEGRYAQFDPTGTVQSVSSELNWYTKYQILGVDIVAQLYRHATRLLQGSEGIRLDLCDQLIIESDRAQGDLDPSQTLKATWRDRYLGQVGRLATVVLSELETRTQENLSLSEQVLGCFNIDNKNPSESITSWKQHNHDMISELSVGVARAIRPDLVLRLVS